MKTLINMLIIVCWFLSCSKAPPKTQWTATNSPRGVNVTVLVSNNQNIFAAGLFDGAFSSTNNGKSWKAVYNLPPRDSIDMKYQYEPTDQKNKLSVIKQKELYHCSNELTNLFIDNLNLPAETITNTIIRHGNDLFAGTQNGIYSSSDNGANWQAQNNGFPPIQINAFAVIGDNLFAGTDVGMYLSKDNGNSWKVINKGLQSSHINMSDPEVCSINALTIRGNIILAASKNGEGVFRSSDNGNSWIAVSKGMEIPKIELGPRAKKRAERLEKQKNDKALSPANEFETPCLRYFDVKKFIVNYNAIFADCDGLIFRSTNNGDVWNLVDQGLQDCTVNDLAIRGKNILAGTSKGLYSSADNGDSWSLVVDSLLGTEILTLTVSGINILAGTSRGIFLSADNGRGWIIANNSLWSHKKLMIIPCGANLFIKTETEVYISTDNGNNWQPFKTGLPDGEIYAIAANQNYLFAAGQNGKIWKSPVK